MTGAKSVLLVERFMLTHEQCELKGITRTPNSIRITASFHKFNVSHSLQEGLWRTYSFVYRNSIRSQKAGAAMLIFDPIKRHRNERAERRHANQGDSCCFGGGIAYE